MGTITTNNFWRPQKSTFQTILDLIESLERIEKRNEIMLTHGMSTRTKAGHMVFIQSFKEAHAISQELYLEYPMEWIKAVRLLTGRDSIDDMLSKQSLKY